MRISFDIKVSFTADEFQELADAVENYMLNCRNRKKNLKSGS